MQPRGTERATSGPDGDSGALLRAGPHEERVELHHQPRRRRNPLHQQRSLVLQPVPAQVGERGWQRGNIAEGQLRVREEGEQGAEAGGDENEDETDGPGEGSRDHEGGDGEASSGEPANEVVDPDAELDIPEEQEHEQDAASRGTTQGWLR
ncbi:hypothetical protein SAY87_019952 [Trapa incisa]|uniref:Uncharacterized protein n=1 Tax=Trapa incisa TaxID=236973 RepID=A0AAN7K2Q6_9MYRT|nr:hypothetical protein SAY87_019952 [Trapa incisa]